MGARQGTTVTVGLGVKELPAEVQLPAVLQQTEPGGGPRRGVQPLDDMERNAILQALAQCHGNKKKAAQLLTRKSKMRRTHSSRRRRMQRYWSRS